MKLGISHKGYELFFTDQDTVDEMRCKVCETVCDVKVGINGPSGFGEAMGRGSHLHDRFDCPHCDEEWHEQALELMQDIEKSPSPTLQNIMKDDLDDIVKKGLKNGD